MTNGLENKSQGDVRDCTGVHKQGDFSHLIPLKDRMGFWDWLLKSPIHRIIGNGKKKTNEDSY